MTCSYHIKPYASLISIFDQVRTGQPFKTSEFTHFIAPLVQDFEAAAADSLDARGNVP